LGAGVLLCAPAATAFAAGDTYCVLMTAGGRSLPFPALARVRYLSFFPLMLAARVVCARRHRRGAPSSAWLDGAVRSPGATSVLAVVLSRRLGEVPMGGRCGVPGAGFLIFAAADVTYGVAGDRWHPRARYVAGRWTGDRSGPQGDVCGPHPLHGLG
jgi:hypothetical protein